MSVDGPRLRCLAPAKVNLGLFVGRARPDGRHELVSVMQSISLADRLTLERARAGAAADEVRCPGLQDENLALKRSSLFASSSPGACPRCA